MSLDTFKLSQTVLKKVESGLCPKRIEAEYINHTHKEEPTENWKKGWFFEEMCIGSTAKDQPPTELTKKKNGEPYIDEIRIIEQAKRFDLLFDKTSDYYLGYNILESQVNLEYEGETGVVDFVAERSDDDLIYLFDIKLTADIDSEMNKYAWSNTNIKNLDLIQAVNYTYLFSQVNSIPVELIKFVYIVFDYTKDMKIKLIKCSIDEGDIEMRNLRFSEGWRIITQMNIDGFPAIPSFKSCFSCPIKECSVRIKTEIPVESITVDIDMDKGNKIMKFNYK